jgi:replicative DNA helicase
MSDGLKLLTAIIAAGAASTLHSLDTELFLETELPAYEFVRDHQRSYREMPQTQTVQSETGIRLPTAHEPLQFYVDQVYSRHTFNLLRENFATLRGALESRDIPEASNVIQEMARATRNSRQGREVMQMDEAMGLVVSRMDQTRGMGGITGIETGWETWDGITGGYQNSDLITFVGRPSLGKTYVILRQAQMAHRAGHNVLFVTTEMGAEQIARRYAALEIGIDPTLLKLNMLSSHVQRRIRSLATEMAGADRLRIFSVGMNSKVSAISALCEEFGPDAVFIDGIYLMQPDGSSSKMNRMEKIAAVFDQTKAINLEVERPFIVTSQFNRQAGAGGKQGSLENIGYTDSIGTHSSIVAAIKTGPTDDPWKSRTLEFLKGREGERGEIAINFKFTPVDFNEFTPEQAQQEQTTRPDLDWMQ